MFKTVPELEAMDIKEIKTMLVEATQWKSWDDAKEYDKQYNSKLYKLASKLSELYGDTTVQQTCDLLSVEATRRLSMNLVNRGE